MSLYLPNIWRLCGGDRSCAHHRLNLLGVMRITKGSHVEEGGKLENAAISKCSVLNADIKLSRTCHHSNHFFFFFRFAFISLINPLIDALRDWDEHNQEKRNRLLMLFNLCFSCLSLTLLSQKWSINGYIMKDENDTQRK